MKTLLILVSIIISSNIIAFDELHCFSIASIRNNYISNFYSFNFDTSNTVHIKKTIYDHKYNSRVIIDETASYRMIYNDSIIDINDSHFSSIASLYHFRIYLKDAPEYITMKSDSDRYINGQGFESDRIPYTCLEDIEEAFETLKRNNRMLNGKYTPVTFE